MIRVVLFAPTTGNDQLLFIVVLAVALRIAQMPATVHTADWHAVFLDSHHPPPLSTNTHHIGNGSRIRQNYPSPIITV